MSSNETWQLYHSTNYANFIAVAFLGGRAAAVYSMASNAASQLKNRESTVLTVAQANAYGGIGALSYYDPGNSSQQYAIMIYDSTSVIGSSRTLSDEGQERLLHELVNAFRARNNRSTLEWMDRLGTPARAHSSNSGSGNLRDRVIRTGYDSARYVGGNTVSGSIDAFGALDDIIDNATGSGSMRTQILSNSITAIGTGFSGGHSGSVKTYYTYTLGNVIPITGVTARQNNTVVSTVAVSVGSAAAVSITLTMAPTGFNETFSITSSNTSRMTVTSINETNAGATLTVTGVASGSANIVVTGSCSGRTHNIPVSVGAAVYANNLTLRCSVTGTSMTLSSNTNVSGNANATGSRTLIVGSGNTLTIEASTTSGAVVEWTRTGGNAATVAKSTSNNNGIITATSTATEPVTIRARVQTGSNTYITHTLTVRVVSVSNITFNPTGVTVGGTTTASATVGSLPTGNGAVPTYAWTSSGNFLSRTPPLTESTTATFTGANAGTSTVTFTALWAGTASNALYLGKIERTANITVQGPQYATGINLSQKTATMYPGQTLEVTAATVPVTITQGYSFSWAPDASDRVHLVSSGLYNVNGSITATSKIGTAEVTVTLTQAGGPTLTEKITISVEWPAIGLIGDQEVASGSFADYRCNMLPDGYTVEWECNQTGDGGDASIDAIGRLTAITPGTVEVVARLLYGGERRSSASLVVTIR